MANSHHTSTLSCVLVTLQNLYVHDTLQSLVLWDHWVFLVLCEA
jgi:hypothetical protein